jgi:hypothetical protein
MESVFRNAILDEASNGTSGPHLEADGQAAPKIGGGSVAASVPSDVAATERESR